ncbi:MAG: alpha/beta hydrolase [Saprospiraceae bacterium]|nr:alpha/beta hydrolase [Saprospiraceae bacterium]
MQRKTLSYRQSTVSYLRFGEGEQLLLAFHGFGDRAAMWLGIEEGLAQKFTVIALDLPFHGHTIWHEKVFRGRDFEAIVHELTKIEGKERFSLAGFSFGARIVERLLFRFEHRIDHILMFAPDGFGTKWLFEITMIPRPIRRFTKWLLDRPQWFVRILSFFYKYKLINRFIYKFTYNHLGRIERRTRLFTYWLSMDDFVIKPERFKAKLKKSEIQANVFVGKNDDIVPLSSGCWLAENAPNIRLHIVEDGHKLVNHNLIADLKKAVLDG